MSIAEVCTEGGLIEIWKLLDRKYVKASYVIADEAQAS